MVRLPETIVSLQHVDKWFGNNHVVKDMNLEIYKGEFLTLLGPSGCGKTTTLRMIAGFEDATGGVIEVEGRERAVSAGCQHGVPELLPFPAPECL